MTNAEKYKDHIFCFSDSFCDFIKQVVYPQAGIPPMACNKMGCARCWMIVNLFMQEECRSPEVDWSTVAVDTPILVSDTETDGWIRRHFAKYEDGVVYAWDEGKTSFTAKAHECTGWYHAKLAEETGR